MATKQSLTALQASVLQQMQQQRSSERRTQKMQWAAIRKYRQQAKTLGYTREQIELQICDIWDMFRLQTSAFEQHRGWL